MYHRFTTPVLATVVFLSAGGCSKKEAASPAPNTGSFQLDGTSLRGQITATRTAGSIGTTFYDWLYLDLALPQPPKGVERVRLLLYKAPGAPASSYLLHNLTVYPGGYNFAGTSFTLTAAEDGSLSGSFTGRVQASSSSIPGPYTNITNGVFTKVKL
jgi:hypothetical protein